MSYNTLVEARTVNAAIEQAHLDDATLYLDARYTWPGKIESTTQPENWPRVASDGLLIVDANGRDLVGVPAQVKRAEIEAAGLIQQGRSLLPTTVATASSVSATTGGQLTEKTSKAGSVTTTRKYSAASSESNTGSSVQEIGDNGYAVIKLLDAILHPIISIRSTDTSTNFYFNRA